VPSDQRIESVLGDTHRPIVAIGASAANGGAIQTLLNELGDAPGLAIIVMQRHPSGSDPLSAEALRDSTSLKIVELSREIVAAPDTVYLCPPHLCVEVTDGRVCPVDVQHEQPSDPVDHLLHSVAQDQNIHGIGVILSDNPLDGASGLKAIRDRGGLTFAQDVDADGLTPAPDTSTSHGVADYILPPGEIATALMRYRRHLAESESSAGNDLHNEITEAVPELIEVLRKNAGHDFRHYKTNTLARRIRRRIQVLTMNSVRAYIDFVNSDQDEAHVLSRDLLIGVTSFFRDPEAFESVRNSVLSVLFNRQPADGCVRIWVAGCANGAEAYTVAMLCCEVMDTIASPCGVRIFATDVDQRALQTARRGDYPLAIEDQVSAERLGRFFARHGDRYQVKPEIRELIVFSEHNLINDPPFSRQDLIVCRNLLIYLDPTIQKKLIPQFHSALRPSGFLFLGPSESIVAHGDLFRMVDPRHRISQSKGTTAMAPSPLKSRADLDGVHAPRPRQAARTMDLTAGAQKLVLDDFAPRYVVIDESGQILNASTGIDKYVRIAGGDYQNNIVRMAASGLRIGLRTAIAESRTKRRRVVQDNLSITTDNTIQRVMLTVQPMPRQDVDESLFLVVFQDAGLPVDLDSFDATAQHHGSDAEALIAQLELALETTRSDLDRTLQDMESANEELKSSNEELLSMNEELQSTNEELESSKEELRASSDAVVRANEDLENLLHSSQIATVFLDRERRIRCFTPAISEIYELVNADVGRPLERIVPNVVDMPPLPDPNSLAEDDVVEDTVRGDSGRFWIRRVLPYQSHTGDADGMVVTFTDVTELRESEERLALALDATSEGAWDWNIETGEVLYSDQWISSLGYTREEVPPHISFWESIVHPEDLAHTRASLERHFAGRTDTFSCENRLRKSSGKYRWNLDRGRIVQRDASGTPLRMVGTDTDISESRRARQKLERAMRQLQTVADAIPPLVAFVDQDQTHHFANAAYAGKFGVPRESIVGEQVRHVVGERIYAEIIPHLQRALNGEQHRQELALPGDQRGADEFRDITFVPEFDGEHHVVGCHIIAVDVTDRKIREQQLTENESVLRRVIDNTLNFVGILDSDGTLLEANQPALDVAGVAREDVIGRPFWECVWWSFDENVARRLRDAVAEANRGQIVRYDSPIRVGDNDRITIDFMLAPVRDGEGRVTHLIPSGVDISERVQQQEQLSDALTRLDISLKVSGAAVWSWDTKLNQPKHNEGLNQLFGFAPAEEPELSKFLERMHKDDRDRVASAIQRSLDEGGPYKEEYRVILPSGDIRWLRAVGQTRRTPDGQIGDFFGVVSDFTDRKLAEQEVAAREAHLRRVIDHQLGLVGLIDRRGNLLEVDNESLRIAGLTRDDVIGRNFAECPWWTYDDAVAARMKDTMRRAFAGETVRYDVPLYGAGLGDSQSRLWIDFMMAPVRNDDGTIEYLIPSGVDISDRKAIEEKHRQTAARLAAIFNEAVDGIITIDGGGTINSVNAAAAEIFGYTADEMVGNNVGILIPASMYNMHDDFLQRYQRSGDRHVIGRQRQLFGLHKDGSTFPLELAVSETTLQEEHRYVGIVRDITQRKAAEKALQDSEARLKLGIEVARFGLAEIDYKANTVSLSKEAAELYGLNDDAIVVTRDEFHATCHPDDLSVTKTAIEECLRAGEDRTLSWEQRVVLPDGQVRWLDVRKQVFFDHSVSPPVPSYGSLAARDFTDRKHRELSLKENEQRLALALKAAHMTAWEWTPEGSYWPVELYEMLGISPEKTACPETFFEAVHPDDLPDLVAAWGRATAGEKEYNHVFRIIRPDGEQRWIRGIGEVVRDSAERVIRVYGLNWDETDEVEFENEMRLNAERIRVAASAAGFGTYHVDLDRKNVVWSEELKLLVGLDEGKTSAAAFGTTPSFVHPADREKFQDHFDDILTDLDEPDHSLIHRIVKPDGEVRYFRMQSRSLFEGEGTQKRLRMIVGTLLDVTQQREYERSLRRERRLAQAASESKSAFLANMSHEIRTPMTAILGYAEMLQELVDNNEARQHLETIRRNGDFLLEIINDILDLSKIEANKLEIVTERFAPHQIVEDVRSIMEVRASEKDLELTVEYSGLIPSRIESDAKRLKQILINLVGNAIKFTKQGSVRISVHHDPQNEALEFAVTDTGVGISKDQQQKLFQPFSQGDASVTREFGGSGLGLAISRRLANMLGGDIVMESDAGRGSTFTLRMAVGDLTGVACVQPEQASRKLPDEQDEQPISLNCHILIVDDRRDVRFLSKAILSKAGAKITEAEDGLQAIAEVERASNDGKRFDLILLDMQMPNLDGYETAQRLREMGFQQPIIALTADAMQGDMNRCIECGCNDYLSKPIDVRQMTQMVLKFTG